MVMTLYIATAIAACLMVVSAAHMRSAGQKFLSDDPLLRAPEEGDASKAAEWDIDLFYDLGYNLFVTTRREPTHTRALNINTIDEVPDSSWFTNRVGTHTLTLQQLLQGPVVGAPPNPSRWTITREKSVGDAPGFTARDANGETWFVSFDAPSNPQGATAAVVIATRIFWALGYNQVEYFLTQMRPEAIQIDPKATKRRPSGKRTPLTQDDVDELLERASRSADGSYRAAAGRMLPGRVLGGFKYQGTRPDDPNDIVPHEHRRELRALRVFGAWTNLVDMKAGNTLDTVITEGGRGIVRHYLQDVGSTFGVGANGPHAWSEGWEYVYDMPPQRKRLFTFGFGFSRWQTVDYEDFPAIGRFEGDGFEPERWKPRAPTAAHIEMRDDDAFWAARRVMAFSDEMIRALVRTGEYSEARAADYLADVLIKRRDKIGRVYLTRINPIVDVVLEASGTLTFANAAVQHGFATPPRQYTATWYAFDNSTGESRQIGQTTSERERVLAPSTLTATPGSFVRIDLSADHGDYPHWTVPVRVFFRRDTANWKLVGVERMPDDLSGTQLTAGNQP
jgi:hypothetical protein